MIPSVLARQLQKGIADYVETTFPMTNAPFKDSFTKALGTKDYLYHEPFISIRLPFCTSPVMPDCFEAVTPSYRPYVHQAKAFERLTGKNPESTLVATGTGSGKTECFLYPILDYCWKKDQEGQRGIKALIIYPMNALASDQSRRIAELIHENPKLKGTVSAGIYVGSMAASHNNMMTEEQIITDRETLRNNPPDILLTNYKMLDYLLIRPEDQPLWSENREDTLKFIAVDEFHTFDGAQGTDLACLLRRMKKRLGTPEHYLCCIGTSATMGDKDSDAAIRDYASQVFGEPFGEGSVITESRLSGDDFLANVEITDVTIPDEADAELLRHMVEQDKEEDYIQKAAASWLSDFREDLRTERGKEILGNRLMHLGYFQSLILASNGNYFHVRDMLTKLQVTHPEIRNNEVGKVLFDALLALISYARNSHGRPFLDVNIQLWMKELRRLEAKVSPDHVEYALGQEMNEEQAKQYLPVVNCRDCGATAWATIPQNENGEQTAALGSDLSAFYNHFFESSTDIGLLYPYDGMTEIPEGMRQVWLCPNCLHMKEGGVKQPKCRECGTPMMPMLMPDLNRKKLFLTSGGHRQYMCPFCHSERGISLMGLRSATEISAEISQMFASRFNDDRKLLAFSDNVQDAAQRAGFFNARTWRFTLRIALQDYVNHGGEGKNLSDFMKGFLSYWHGKLSDEDFVANFIAPNMVWMDVYEDLTKTRKLPDDPKTAMLMRDIEKRLCYEILLEYGRAGHIGRTLEKSRCSALSFHKEDIREAAQYILKSLAKEPSLAQYAAETTEEEMEQTVLRFLDTMKFYGAIQDSTFEVYLQNRGKSYLLSADHENWRPGLQSRRNVPRFLIKNDHITASRAFDHAEQKNYVSCIVGNKEILKPELQQRVSTFVLNGLIHAGLVEVKEYPALYDVCGINEEKAYISTYVKQLRCDICGSQFTVSGGMENLWDHADCLREGCKGHLVLDDQGSLDYYGHLYNTGIICRVNAKEHTGLLDSKDKNDLEKNFKLPMTARRPFDPNVLSCTPTLEMGIDIGDLDTVVLCSMPPTQAQFLQRCGRAGRKDGNALVMTVANAKPHDLYFYADPMAMISGHIDAPKIFLKASAVLERQLIAYCMDCWVKKGLGPNDIPETVGPCLTELKKNKEGFDNGSLGEVRTIRFPFNFLYFVQNHLTELLESFENLFAHDIDDAAREALENFAKGTGSDTDISMQVKILRQFENLLQEEECLKKDRQDLRDYLKLLQKGPTDSSNDDELKEVQQEIDGVTAAIRKLQGKNIYGFMADEGLLPNYAFPEEGITLRAMFTLKENKKGRNENQKRRNAKVEEFNRSAASAISEFAPENTFYAGGHKMTITRVDTNTAKPEIWRLCPNCSHAEREETARKHSVCPVCHSADWPDSGQKVTMLKPQIVYSKSDYSDSLIEDDSENRTVRFYTRQMLVDVSDDDIVKAYEMDNKYFPFGYEFAKKATLREINFGLSDYSGTKSMVNGLEEVRKGFRVCRYCGTVQPENEEKEAHTKTCPAGKDFVSPEYQDAIVPCMYLYREFSTEVLRILIPVTSQEISEKKQESFTAAFMLGLKEYFGNVDHIHATVCDVPSEEGPYRKKYLVVYDSVPGGTGYLKQLMENKDSLVQVFEKSLAVMENCSCNEDPKKDGCYRCLFAYRQSRNIGNISRNEAEKMVRSILSGKDNIKEIPKLGSIKTNPIFDSELEASFIEAIRRSGNDQRTITVTSEILNRKEGYVVRINESVWEIEPQVHLGKADGIAVDSKPDFILRLNRNPKGVKPEYPRKDIAVFTDGFTYHWDIADKDSMKRNAIMQSSKYRVWSLSYDDVESVLRRIRDYATVTMDSTRLPGHAFYKSIKAASESGGTQLSPDKLSPFDMLLWYLAEPNAEKIFQQGAAILSFGYTNPQTVHSRHSIDFTKWQEYWNPVAEIADFTDGEPKEGETIFGVVVPEKENPALTICAGLSKNVLNGKKAKDLPSNPAAIIEILDDTKAAKDTHYQRQWNGFWQFANFMQFLPQFIAVTRKGIESGSYFRLPVSSSVPESYAIEGPGIEWQKAEDEWKETMDLLLSDEEKEFADKVKHLHVMAPEIVGEDVEDRHHRIIGTMTMGWKKFKVCFLSSPDYTDKISAYLRKQGWTVLTKESSISEEMFGGKM
jgi:DEAD/DEAH box helicase domain-containing protein